MSQGIPNDIAAFFIYNPHLGREDTEGEKILTYYPEIDINTQKDYVGLCEGLIGFAEEFSKNKPLDTVQTAKFRFTLYAPEPDFVMVMMINRCSHEVSNEDDRSYTPYLQNILKKYYEIFCIHNGTLGEVLKLQKRAGLRARLALLSGYFLPTIQLPPLLTLSHRAGFHYLSVERTAFLTIQYLVASLHAHFPRVQCGLILCDNRLIWSSLCNQDALQLSTLINDTQSSHWFEYIYKNTLLTPPNLDDKPVKRPRGVIYGDENLSPCPAIDVVNVNYSNTNTQVYNSNTDGWKTGNCWKEDVLPLVCLSKKPNVDNSNSNQSTSIFNSIDNEYICANDTVYRDADGHNQYLLIYQVKQISIVMIITDNDLLLNNNNNTKTLDDEDIASPNPEDNNNDNNNNVRENTVVDNTILPQSGTTKFSNLCNQLSKFLLLNLTKIASILNAPKKPNNEDCGFLYINSQNLAVKDGLSKNLAPDVIASLNQLHHSFYMANERLENEAVVKKSGVRERVKERMEFKDAEVAMKNIQRERVRREKQRDKDDKRRLEQERYEREERENELNMFNHNHNNSNNNDNDDNDSAEVKRFTMDPESDNLHNNDEEDDDDGDTVFDREIDPAEFEDTSLKRSHESNLNLNGEADHNDDNNNSDNEFNDRHSSPPQEEEEEDDDDDEGDYDQQDLKTNWSDVYGKSHSHVLESYIRTKSAWVIGRRAVQSKREFYIVVDEKTCPSLVDAQAHVDKLAKNYFSNIFIY